MGLRSRSSNFLLMLLFVAATVFLAGGVPAAHPQQRQQLDVSPLRATTQEDLEIATAFDRLGSNRIADLNLDRFRRGAEPPEIGIWLPTDKLVRPHDAAPLNYLAYLSAAVCSSDAVVFGRSIGERTFLNRRETFLFTQRQFRVDQWLKPSSSTGQPTIQINTPGGTASIGGAVITAIAGSPFENSEPSVLFLKRLGTTRGHVLATPMGQVVFRKGFAKVVGETFMPTELSQGEVSRGRFLADVEAAGFTCQVGRR